MFSWGTEMLRRIFLGALWGHPDGQMESALGLAPALWVPGRVSWASPLHLLGLEWLHGTSSSKGAWRFRHLTALPQVSELGEPLMPGEAQQR